VDRFAGASIKPVNDILCKRWFPVRIQQNRVVTDDRLAAIAMDDIGMHGEPAPSGHVETKFAVAPRMMIEATRWLPCFSADRRSMTPAVG